MVKLFHKLLKAEEVQEHNMAGVQGGVILAEGGRWHCKDNSQGKPRFICALICITFTANSIAFQASNAAMLAQLLPLLPPVVIGLYVLFAAFWPQRILFFSSKQRRKTMNDQGGKWTNRNFELNSQHVANLLQHTVHVV